MPDRDITIVFDCIAITSLLWGLVYIIYNFRDTFFDLHRVSFIHQAPKRRIVDSINYRYKVLEKFQSQDKWRSKMAEARVAVPAVAVASAPVVGSAVAYVYKPGKSGRSWEGTVLYVNPDLGIVTVAWDAVSGKPRPHFQTNTLAEVVVIPQLAKDAARQAAKETAEAQAEKAAGIAKRKATAAKKSAEGAAVEKEA